MFKIRKIFLLVIVALSCCLSVATAQVTVDAKLDSAITYIGQRRSITIEVAAESDALIEMPQWDSMQYIVPGVEFLGTVPADTEFVNGGKRMVVSKTYYITSFDSALYYIDSIGVKVGGKPYHTRHLALKVLTMDIDTMHTDSIFGIKEQMKPEFEWAEWHPVMLSLLFIALFAAALVYVIKRFKDNKPIIRRIRREKKLAPHAVAMQKIEEIKENKVLWQAEDSKEYYTQLTDALRQYIYERYGFNAMEMTSFEIIQHLESVNDQEAINELRELFQTADLVKFAKYNTLINENDRNLVYAVEYINQTKKEEKEDKKPEVEIVVEERSKNVRRALMAGIAVCAVAILALLGYGAYRLYMLLL